MANSVLEKIAGVYRLFFSPGEVTEVRAFGLSGNGKAWRGFSRGTISGYFNDPVAFAKAAHALDLAGAAGVYFTINPVSEAFFARAPNTLVAGEKTTKDEHIKCIRWLPVDLDPLTRVNGKWIKRSGFSSDEKELERALNVAKKTATRLEDGKDLRFGKGLRAVSGNGYHLCYRLDDLPNEPETERLIRDALHALKAEIGTPSVDVDLSVFNPARIWKVYGTTARKGGSTKDRPHRQAYLLKDQPETLALVPTTTRKALEKLASMRPRDDTRLPVPATPKKDQRREQQRESDLGKLKVPEYLAAYGVQITRINRDNDAYTTYAIDRCVFDPDHGRDASIVQDNESGKLSYQCWHDGCKAAQAEGKRLWRHARKMISGDDPINKFCEGYDPNWKPPRGRRGGKGSDVDLEAMGLQPIRYVGVEGALKRVNIKAVKVPDPHLPDPTVKPPGEIDPSEFFTLGSKGRPECRDQMGVRYFVAYFGGHLSYSPETGLFWYYDYQAGHYKQLLPDQLGQIIAVCLGDYCKTQYITQAVLQAKSTLVRMDADWPPDPRYINCLSGMLDLETGKVVPHDPKYNSRSQIQSRYDPQADAQPWYTFLDQIFPGEPHKIDALQEFMGYCLMPDCRYEACMFLFGSGANGKGTVLHQLFHVLGEQNCSSLNMDAIGENNFGVAFLKDRMVNVCSEMITRNKMATETLKQMVSGEPVTTQKKFRDHFQFRPTCKFIFAMDKHPVISDRAFGFERRLIVITFNQRFDNESKDPDLKYKLEKCRDGIFYWMLLGLERLRERGRFITPEETKEFLANLNPLVQFVEDECVIEKEKISSAPAIWKAYKHWAAEGGYRTMQKGNFYGDMNRLPGVEYAKRHGPNKRAVIIGLRLKDITERSEDD